MFHVEHLQERDNMKGDKCQVSAEFDCQNVATFEIEKGFHVCDLHWELYDDIMNGKELGFYLSHDGAVAYLRD